MTIARLPVLPPKVTTPVAVRPPNETRRRERARRDFAGDTGSGDGPTAPSRCGVTAFDGELRAPAAGGEVRAFHLATDVDYGPYVSGSGLQPRNHTELYPPVR